MPLSAQVRQRRFPAAAIPACVLLLAARTVLAAPPDGPLPYPPSTDVTDMRLDWATFRRLAEDSDNWPTTLAADGTMYTAWGDGGGFGPQG